MKPVVTALVMTVLASCSGPGSPEVEVSEAWARPTLTSAQPGAVYLKIVNRGQAADRLDAVTSKRARASLHNSVVENGIVRMRPVAEGISVAAGSSVALKPNGIHIMLQGLDEPLEDGTTFSLTLQFEKSGDRQVQVRVAGGSTESHDGH